MIETLIESKINIYLDIATRAKKEIYIFELAENKLQINK